MPGSSEQREQALRHPLVLGNHEARVNDDIDLLAEHISLAVPLRDIMAIGPSRHFRQRSSYRIAGDTSLMAATITPTRMEVEESKECSIVLVTQGPPPTSSTPAATWPRPATRPCSCRACTT